MLSSSQTSTPAPNPTTAPQRKPKARAAHTSVATRVATAAQEDTTSQVQIGAVAGDVSANDVVATVTPNPTKPKTTAKRKKKAQTTQPEDHVCAKCGKPGADEEVVKRDEKGKRILRRWWLHSRVCAPQFKASNRIGVYVYNHNQRRAMGMKAHATRLPLMKPGPDRCGSCHTTKPTGTRWRFVPMGRRRRDDDSNHPDMRARRLCSTCYGQRAVDLALVAARARVVEREGAFAAAV